VIIYNCFN